MARTKRGGNPQPFEELISRNLKAVIWENSTQSGPMFNVELKRVYKLESGEWQETHTLGRDDLLLGSHLMTKAYDVIDEEVSARKQRQKSG